MANYSVTPCEELANGTWKAIVTYDLPDVEGCVDSTDVEFIADSEYDLSMQLQKFIIKINNNID